MRVECGLEFNRGYAMVNTHANSGTFKKGDGRNITRAGAQNKTTRVLKDAMLLAAEECGDLSGIKDLSQEGVENGKDGLVGYLRWAAKCEPKSFISLLGRLLPTQAKVDTFAQTVYKSYHEVSTAFADRGLSLEAIEKLKQIDLQPDLIGEDHGQEEKAKKKTKK
jgi:hypothetical protein